MKPLFSPWTKKDWRLMAIVALFGVAVLIVSNLIVLNRLIQVTTPLAQ